MTKKKKSRKKREKKPRKTDTDRILIYILSSVAGETVRDEEDFILKTFIETENDLKEVWSKVREVMENIIMKSKDSITLESRREILERIKVIIDAYIEWDKLPEKFYDINQVMYEKVLSKIMGEPKVIKKK